VATRVRPTVALEQVALTSLCVTKGTLSGTRVDVPTFRAVAPGHGGDAASIRFVARGSSATLRALASGQQRRQLGLKLRAQNGCNLVYVMWRLDPASRIEVSVKRNPGARTASDCGAGGYTKLKGTRTVPPPPLQDVAEHELRAEIDGGALTAWIDDRVVWRGELPAKARELSGPAGVRSDNLAFEISAVAVDARLRGEPHAQCSDVDE
jgi:hypothetical protein